MYDIIDAAINDDSIALEELLKKGSDPNFAEDIAGVTPLHFAVMNDSRQAIKILVKAGANIFSKTMTGESPVDLAKMLKNDKIMELLLNKI